jgi:hypothetical protein
VRKLTDEEAKNLAEYYAKCMSLYDFIELKIMPTNLYMHNIKKTSKLFMSEIDAQTSSLMKVIPKENVPYEEKEWNNGYAHYLDMMVVASKQADRFYTIASRIAELEDKEAQDKCVNEVNEIFEKYGVL